MMVGTTIASMMATESMRIVASPWPTTPFGASTFGWQPAKGSAAMRPPKRRAIDHRALERRRPSDHWSVKKVRVSASRECRAVPQLPVLLTSAKPLVLSPAPASVVFMALNRSEAVTQAGRYL